MENKASQERGKFKYHKCKACKGTGYTTKERDNPIFAGVCRICQGMGILGKKIKPKHVPQYTGGPFAPR